MQEQRLKTNLDTNLIKLIAIIAMTVDHIGGAFFPEYPVFRWIGRIAFPLFCYCLTVGMLYTHDKKISASFRSICFNLTTVLDFSFQFR